MHFNLIQKIVLWGIPLLFAVTVHEVAHGWMAYKLGDPTAKMMGRLTLNPIKHIDPIGTLLVPSFFLLITGTAFGWAKPVPILWRNLRHFKRDLALVAAAGPLSNLAMALSWGAIAKCAVLFSKVNLHWSMPFIYMGILGVSINCIVMLLNLIPIPPLDGSRIASSFLTPRLAYYYARIEPFGFIILILLLALGILSKLLFPLVFGLSAFIISIFGLSDLI